MSKISRLKLLLCDLDGDYDDMMEETIAYIAEHPKEDLEGLPTVVFFTAVKIGKLALLQRCKNEWGVDPKVINGLGENALHVLMRHKPTVESVKLLIDLGVDPLALRKCNSSILHDAASSGVLSVVQYVVDNYPQLCDLLDEYGKAAIFRALHRGEVFSYLFKAHPAYSKYFNTHMLHESLRINSPQIEVIRILLDNNVDPEAKTERGLTSLDLAEFRHRHADEIIALIRSKIAERATKPSSSSADAVPTPEHVLPSAAGAGVAPLGFFAGPPTQEGTERETSKPKVTI